MSVYDLAQKYYPRLWDKSRLEALLEAGRLTAEEYLKITGEDPATETVSESDTRRE